ncbi:MBL fold metallo-hydrolase [Streptomyces sp. Rer75]|uniref:MBL fold metallo-hydrolase n=1 Tax=unclassified Streptomyces TaxID=2593676 RepID=UPI0015D038EA|nr:MBL fold metallo-hydrolase [Streptomyces sp. Rer75]QLH26392.1 MBL fold metallo-hydrolase [Streptomyces sp. Rer75]
MNSPSPLIRLADGVHLWTPTPSAGWGLANCGLIVSPDGAAAWIDTPYDRRMAQDFLDRSRSLLPEGGRIGRVIVTHANGDHLWGAEVVRGADVVATREALGHIEYEPAPQQLHAMVRGSDPETPLGWYLQSHFGRFNWADTEVVEPTTTFTGELDLRIGQVPVQLTALPAAHTTGDLIAYLPQQKVAFTGDVIFASSPDDPGDHAVHWAGPLDSVIAACERVLDTGAQTIVPGHGPVLDREGVRGHIGYLEHIRDRARQLHTAGVPALEAARKLIAENAFPLPGLPERMVITVGTEYRHLNGGEDRPDIVAMIADVAQVAWDLRQG